MKSALIIVAFLVLLFGFVAFRGAPYVPSKRRDVRRAFDELYPVKSDDVLVDVGSGDGIVLREAARRGAARAIGYELNPLLVVVSRWISYKYSAVTIRLADFWFVRLPDDTTVVYAFGESRDIEKIAKKIQQEATRIGHSIAFMSYGFSLKGQEAAKTVGAHHLYHFEPLQQKEA